MNPENKNNQPPIELADTDQAYFESLGRVASATEQRDAAGDHVMAVRQSDGSAAEKAQANLDYEAADMERQAAERRARVQAQRDKAAATIGRLFGRR